MTGVVENSNEFNSTLTATLSANECTNECTREDAKTAIKPQLITENKDAVEGWTDRGT